MKWISVKDKLPKEISDICEYDWVFVVGKNEKGLILIGVAQMCNGKWNIIGNEGAFSDVGTSEFKSEHITHFMRCEYPK